MRHRIVSWLVGLALALVVGAGAWVMVHEQLLAHARESAHTAAQAGDRSADCTRCHGPKGVAAEVGLRPRQPTPWAMAAGAGGRLFVACPPRGAVAEIDTDGGRIARWIDVGGEADGVAMAPDGSRLAVALADRDAVVFVDLRSGRPGALVAVGMGPRGVCFDESGTTLVVANRLSHDVSIVDVETGAERARLGAGEEPFSVARSPVSGLVAVASRRADRGRPEQEPSSEITLIDPARGVVTRRVRVASSHMIEGLTFDAEGTLLVPALFTRNRLPILQVDRGWTLSSVLLVIDPTTGVYSVLPLSEPNQGFADPAGIAVAAGAGVALVASGGTDTVGVLDLEALEDAKAEGDPAGLQRLSMARRYLVRRVATGSNPRGVVALPIGGRAAFAVSERLGDAVALHARDGTRVARVVLASESWDDAIRRGERVFHDARYAFQEQFSCRSCHPGGHTDGLTYDFDIDGIGRNVVLNRSLLGVAGTQPFKWIGLNPTLARQCGPRFAMVLSRADLFPEQQLLDLVAHLHSLPPPRSVPSASDDAIDPEAFERGRAIFHRWQRRDGTRIPASARCVTCHPPPMYTTRGRADVGTRSPTDDTGEFDVPHLTGIASKAPYLHDGRAPTLEEIWTTPGVDDSHGVVTDLSKQGLNDLIEFLRGL